jgi:ubiquinone/menaquinone biosynthesis C-methylase UbiE
LGGSKDLTRRFFGRHAAGYAANAGLAHGEDLDVLIHDLRPSRSDLVLDVGTGTGFTALALASRVKRVEGVDITEEMLREGRTIAKKRAITNITFTLGDAMRLEYPRSSFDIVVTRRATHHFVDVSRFLREANRILRPGGKLGIVDMTPPEGTEAFINKIEKLRDPSHARAYSPSEWRSLLNQVGFEIRSESITSEPLTLDQWLYPVETAGAEWRRVREEWKSATPKTRRLLDARFESGEVKGWSKSRIVVVSRSKTSLVDPPSRR